MSAFCYYFQDVFIQIWTNNLNTNIYQKYYILQIFRRVLYQFLMTRLTNKFKLGPKSGFAYY